MRCSYRLANDKGRIYMNLPVSVCVITENEEKNIARCLSSFKRCGFELVVVDTGSTDRTKEEARRYTDKVFDFEWNDDFSAARNYSLSKASNDWIFVIDSDEWLESADTGEMDYFMHHLCKAAGSITRINKVGTPEAPRQTEDHTERFFDRRIYHYEGIIHEQLVRKIKGAVDAEPIETYLMKVTIGHDGYCMDYEARIRKAERNRSLLLKELERDHNNINNPYLYYQLGKASSLAGDNDGAISYYRKGLSFKPDPSLAYVESMIILYGDALIADGDAQAATALSSYMTSLGDCADYCDMLGDADLYIGTRNSRREAAGYYRKALAAKRENAAGAGSDIPSSRLRQMAEEPLSLCRHDQKLISIIVPCYNAVSFLKECFDSIKKQTIGMEHLQVIFVDDASTDDTWKMLQSFEKELPGSVCIIHCDKNGRQGTARNIALSHAVGEYIQYVDADDWIEKDMCLTMYSDAVVNDSDIVCCCGLRDGADACYVYPNLTDGINDKRLLVDSDEKRSMFLLTSSMGGVTCNKLISKDFLVQNNISFPERLAYEDNYWYNILYLYAERVYIDHHNFYHYRINPDSTVMSRDQVYQDDLLDVNTMKWKMWDERGFLGRFRNELEVDFLYSAYLGYLRIIFVRYDKVRFDLFTKLKDFVLGYIPDYRTDPLIETNFSEFDRLLLEMLVTPVDEKEFASVETYALEYMHMKMK